MTLAHPPGPAAPARLFAWLRWRILANTLRQVAAGSSMRALSILLCSLVVWGFVFAISYLGFRFFQEQRLFLAGSVVTLLFDLLFLALAVLLIFSTGLILYSSLFAAAETAFLLSSPAPDDQVFAHKFLSALAFSSWAFLLLGGPVLLAFGIATGSPWHYYVFFLPLYFLGFLLLPGSLGASACLLLVNLFPQRRKQMVWLLLGLAAMLIVGGIYRAFAAVHTQNFNRDTVERLMGSFELAQSPLLPSHWIAWGLPAAARNDLATAIFYLALVWSNGLFAWVVTTWLARKLYRRGFNRLTTGGTMQRRPGGHALDRMLESLLFFLSPQLRLLIVKDFRTFRRDPAQWAQVLIFSLLLVLYFLNIRRLFLRDMSWAYQNGCSLLNLGATAMLLCTYTGRFIYPMLSLEGQKFWILGLLPLDRGKLLWGKFVFSATGGLLIALILVLISDLMLEMPLFAILLHALTVLVLTLGLSGLSVGLGACMPSFRERDPSKIAAGFGGTLNLVTGLGYLILIVALMSAPWHVFAGMDEGGVTSPVGLIFIAFGAVLGLGVGVAAVLIPLHYGSRQLQRMEF